MDTGEFLAGITRAKAAMKGLSGDLNIRTDGLDRAVAKVDALKNSLSGMSANIRVTTDGLGTAAAKAAAFGKVGGTSFRPYILGFRLTGNAVHWLISSLAELAAVAIPATMALAAGLAVMAPAAISVAQHMQALATATQATNQMFGQTIGSALGLKGSLSAMQDAAKPAVFSMLGSALITANEGANTFAATGLKVTQMLQTFAAKVAVDFGPNGSLGQTMHALGGSMTSDLQGIGQVLGNIVHTIANVAAAMPGLAEFLLKGLSGITGFLSHLSGAAPILITVGMGFEELVRWGGLAATILAKLGGALGSVLKLAGLAEAGSKVSALAKALQALGKTGLGKIQIAGVAALAAGVAILTYKLLTAKNAMQQFGIALQQATLKSTNVNAMSTIANNISQLNQRLATTPKVLNGTAQEMMRFGNAAQTVNPEIASGSAAIAKQVTQMRNLAQGAMYVARTYGTTFVGALALADQAGVKLAAGITGTSQAAMVARMQIQSLVDGYKAMGQSSGQVGTDMTALAIQSGLAATGVSKLNSAWDDFTSNLTGGTSALAAFGQDLTGLTSATTKFGNVLGKQGGSVSLGVKQFADSLKSFSGAGATAWQNFGQAISKGQALVDWMRTAGAEGAMSAKQFRQAGLDMASAFVPLAASSKTAQAELMGLVQQIDPSIHTFGQLKSAIANSGASFNGLGSIIGGATQKMANMQSVAQTLGTSVSNALVSALSAATVAASGAGAAMQKFAQDLMNGNTAAASADYKAVIGDLEKLGLSAQQAAALVNQVAQSVRGANGLTANMYVYTHLITTGAGSSMGVNPGASAPGAPVPHHAKGTPSAAPGWAWVGEQGPELVKMRGGETVLPHDVSMGYAGGAGSIPDQSIHIYIDGREVHAAVSRQSVERQRRTGNTGMSRRTR